MLWFKVLALPVLLTIGLIFYNEYFIFYKAFSSCSFPCKHGRCSEDNLKAFIISDTHLLGERNGHWLDKLKREWQMYQSFWISTWIHNPEVVFFLGDLMDEGKWASGKLFSSYAQRFHQLFEGDIKVVTLAGNHDIGFHYAIMPDTYEMFRKEFKRGLIDEIQIKGNRFVLINSMALHGDGCRLCHEAEIELEKMKKRKPPDRPIVLQHFPLFRKSDGDCEKIDENHDIDYKEIYREQWDTLSEKSTQKLIDTLNPKAVFGGHTHKLCKRRWRKSVTSLSFYEYTLNSFSWRNGDIPAIFLVVVDGDDVLVSTCRLPSESTQITVYLFGGLLIGILTIFLFLKGDSIFKQRYVYSLLIYRSQKKSA
uniref:Metallophosphoesterase 1 homolog n=1 Tax=Caenorhabditis tropicalis TaxID=1561998 RepID=A0A1I7T4H9_9PELO